MHCNGVELDLVALVGRVQLGDRPEGGDTGVVAQDADVAATEFLDQNGTRRAVGEVRCTDLHLDAVRGAKLLGEGLHALATTGNEDQGVSA